MTSERVYHFITGGLLKEWGKSPLEVYHSIMVQGKLKARAFRPIARNSLFLTVDAIKDLEYVFLTGSNSFLEGAYKTPNSHLLNLQVYGFVLNAAKLRNRDGIFFREMDILQDYRTSSSNYSFCNEEAWRFTKPFKHQLLIEKCEILVYKELNLKEYLIGRIEDGIEILDPKLDMGC